jgi:flagellin-like hook-associated protein FlgL
VQLQGFADDSAYGGVNLLQDEQVLDVQMGENFDDSVFTVEGFHVEGAGTINDDGEVDALNSSDLPSTWKINDDGATGAAEVGDYTSMTYNPLDRDSWTRYNDVNKVVEGTASGNYVFTYTDGTTQSVSGIAKLEQLNGSYWAASESTVPTAYGEEVSLYAFTLNKVEDSTEIVGIKSYGTDQTSITGHEIDWGNSSSYTEDLESVLEQIEAVEEVLETRSKLFSFDSATVTLREEYTEEFINALETGADQLTLADLNEEAANLLALQTAQELGVQGLSLTNEQTQNVLRLLS